MAGKEEITLREMLRDHIEKSEEFRKDMVQSIARIETHHEYTQKKLILVDKHEASHNKQKGVLWFLSLVGIAEIGHFISKLFEHSNK